MSDAGRRRYATGLARQEELLDAAHQLFAAEGFGGVSLRRIAARVGISHAALLRYFTSKDDILIALLDRWERGNVAWIEEHEGIGLTESVLALARRNAAIPGYVALFAALTGEATSTRHPAHEHVRRRYERLRENPHEIDGSEDAVRVFAGWDGIQIMSRYLDDIDVVAELDAHLARPVERHGIRPDSRARRRPAAAELDDLLMPVPAVIPEGSDGYATGRENRARIIAGATELLAERGFAGTSLREVAERVGTSKATLLHHFGSKDGLLAAVLTKRDEQLAAMFEAPVPPLEFLRRMIQGARENAQRPGLIELYTVLSCEGTAAEHPAHQFFERRFELVIAQFESAFAMLRDSGEIEDDRDPYREAVWFVALWDGLQIQWLYDADAVDVADELSAHLSTLVVGSGATEGGSQMVHANRADA